MLCMLRAGCCVSVQSYQRAPRLDSQLGGGLPLLEPQKGGRLEDSSVKPKSRIDSDWLRRRQQCSPLRKNGADSVSARDQVEPGVH